MEAADPGLQPGVAGLVGARKAVRAWSMAEWGSAMSWETLASRPLVMPARKSRSRDCARGLAAFQQGEQGVLGLGQVGEDWLTGRCG